MSFGCSTSAGPPESGWVTDATCSTSGGTRPPGLVEMSSFANNINVYQGFYGSGAGPWNLYNNSLLLDDWKSPSVAGSPDDVTAVPGWHAHSTYNQIDAGNTDNGGWEWNMIYEWSVPLASCGASTIQ